MLIGHSLVDFRLRFSSYEVTVRILQFVLSPFVATIIRLALSRNREYLADASAVEFTRNPEGLKSALIKIATSKPMEAANAASKTRKVKGYTVKVDYQPLQETEKHMKRQALASIVFKSFRRDKPS